MCMCNCSILILEGEIYSISNDQAESIFEVKLPNIISSSAGASASQLEEETQDNERNIWTKQDTLKLIDEYKNNEKLFASATMRNKVVWQRIAGIVKNHNATQCENRMKYLKNQYIKKRESMGPTNSGGTSMRCSFFEELNEIFGQKPSITPMAIASSSQKQDEPVLATKRRVYSLSNSESDEEEVKKKKSKFELNLQNFEKSRKKRHEENLKRKDEALQLFREFSTNIVNILKDRNKKTEKETSTE